MCPTHQLLLHFLLLTQLQVSRDLGPGCVYVGFGDEPEQGDIALTPLARKENGAVELTIMASNTVRCGSNMSSCMM